jgi:hypothetical protein
MNDVVKIQPMPDTTLLDRVNAVVSDMEMDSGSGDDPRNNLSLSMIRGTMSRDSARMNFLQRAAEILGFKNIREVIDVWMEVDPDYKVVVDWMERRANEQ